MARILIGVSGGIAAYKAIELARLATLAGHGVRVRDDPGRASLRRRRHLRGHHRRAGADRRVRARPRPRRLSRRTGARARADLAPRARRERRRRVVAPASANTIAKLAAGICDSMLTTSFLATTAPRLVAPAMNNRMWEDAATAANVATLRDRGVEVLEPGEGALASRGERGAGRMQEPREILAAIEAALGGGRRRRPGTACACSSPRAGPARRSTPSASSATARAAAWASRSPPPRRGEGRRHARRRQRRARPAAPGVERRVESAAELAERRPVPPSTTRTSS